MMAGHRSQRENLDHEKNNSDRFGIRFEHGGYGGPSPRVLPCLPINL